MTFWEEHEIPKKAKIIIEISDLRLIILNFSCAEFFEIDIKNIHALKTKKKQKPNPNRYFSKDRFQQFLKIIIARIAAELAQKHTEIYDKDEINVHAIELEKNGNELWIKIEWKEGLPIE